MNRSVLDRQMFRNGGYVRAMQEGGDPMMAPPMPEQAPPMLPVSSALPTGASVSMEQAAAGAAQQGVDPTVLGSMLEQASGMITNLDAAADTGDYEQIINAIRGDEMPLQERRQELAGVVGDADAAQTPDSVLTLLQPIMQLTAVDQGIGALASETMNTPVTGDMAGGIMSTVNMAEEAPMPGQGGPAPVNFNQGGAVQYMADGGAAEPNRLEEIFATQQPLYRSLLNAEEEAAALAEQKKMTQAQMLFDIAQGGLLFASGAGKPGGTPAEQLAAAFVEPLGNISTRAGEFQKYKDAQSKDARSVDLAALQASSELYQLEKDQAARLAVAQANAAGDLEAARIRGAADLGAARIRAAASRDSSAPSAENFMDTVSGRVVSAIPGTETHNFYVESGFPRVSIEAPPNVELLTFVNQNDLTDIRRIDVSTSEGRNELKGLGSEYVEIETPSIEDIRGDKDSGQANIKVFVNRNDPNDIIRLDVGTKEGRDQANALGPNYLPVSTPTMTDLGGDATSGQANIKVFVNRNNPNDTLRIDVGTKEGRDQANALGQNYLPVSTPTMDDLAGGSESPLGSSFNARFLELVSDEETMAAYANGTLDQSNPNQAALLTNTLTLATQSRPVWDQTEGREVLMPAVRLSEPVMDVIRQRRELGLPTPTLGADVGGPQIGAPASSSPTEQTPGRVRFNEDGTIDFSSFENDPTFIITGVDLTKSQDWTSGVTRAFNMMAGQLQPIFGGSGYSGESGRITSEADTQLDRLANQVMRVIRGGTDGRIFALDANLLEKEVNKFRPGSFKTDNSARDALVTTRNALASSWNDAQLVITSPELYDRATITGARTLQSQVERLLAETTAAVSVYDRFISGTPLSDAASDRSMTAPRTSTLPRSSSYR